MKLTTYSSFGWVLVVFLGALITCAAFLGLGFSPGFGAVGIIGGIVVAVLAGIGSSCAETAHYVRYLAVRKHMEVSPGDEAREQAQRAAQQAAAIAQDEAERRADTRGSWKL